MEWCNGERSFVHQRGEIQECHGSMMMNNMCEVNWSMCC